MSFWTEVEAWFSKVGGEIANFVSGLARTIAVNGGPILVEAAQAAVLAAESSGKTGSEKRADAIAAVIAILESKGIPIVLNAINGAIEAAVANLTAAKVPA